MPFGNSYSNNLDLTDALNNKDKCISLIKDTYGYIGPIETGGFYIMPEGTIIKSANHMDIDKLLIKNKFIKKLDQEPLQFGDGSQFMDAINCVRIRRRGGKDAWILPYMILPEDRLTEVQFDILKNWIDFVLNHSGELSVQTIDGQNKVFKQSQGYIAEDVIMAIKLYYISDLLEAHDTNLEIKHKHDNQLLDAIDKGYFNQF